MNVKVDFYNKKDVVETYDYKRFGGRSGRFVNDEETGFYINFFSRGFVSSDRVLDVPVGTGRLAIKLKDFVSVVGADSSGAMIEYCMGRLKGLGVHLYLEDAKCTSFVDEFFDGVVCSRFFHHFKDFTPFLKEFVRITKKNGFVLFDVFGWSPQSLSSDKSIKVYSHSVSSVLKIAKSFGLKLVHKESKFILPPLLLRRLPYPIMIFTRALEKLFPNCFKTRHFFIFKKVVGGGLT